MAHEPPLLELLPDAAQQRAKTEDVIETFHREGLPAAMTKFMINAGFDVSGQNTQGTPVMPEPSPQRIADGTRFITHELRGTAGYQPRLGRAHPRPGQGGRSRMGAASGGLITYRTSVALAERLGRAAPRVSW